DNNVELAMLERCVRDDLDETAPRVMGVLDPLKVVIENYPKGDTVEELSAANHPKDESMGTRMLPFTRELYIDRDDFREQANRKYKRLVAGGEVRLRYAYVIKAESVIRNDAGEITELRCTYDPDTLGKNPEGRKVRGVIHWVSATESPVAEFRLYHPLFTVDFPDADERDYRELMNPDSLIVKHGYVECGLRDADVDDRYQFEREGYFCIDPKHHGTGKLVFNRTVGLRDTWAKIENKEDQ
ncbi:MAG: glutamine--tRNA ligase, partial [Pseudomonadales bacterium]